MERFWARVHKTETCWLWHGKLSGTKPWLYGEFNNNGNRIRAHRFSWELHNGNIPVGMLVCHHCDNPPCCNPAHLWLGTSKDNAADRDAKGRQEFFKGEDHNMARLTESDVRKIRSMYLSGIRGKKLDGAFLIAKGYGWRIANRRAWSHVH